MAGIAWGLLGMSKGRLGRGGPALAAASLLSLTLLAGIVAMGTASPATHASEHPEGHVAIAADDPVLAELRGVLIGGGTKKALAHLERLAADDEHLTQHLHHYVHELGAFSYAHYGDADTAFHRCRRS